MNLEVALFFVSCTANIWLAILYVKAKRKAEMWDREVEKASQ